MDSIELLTSLVNEITASLKVVLSSQKIFEFSQELQRTNAELEQQARELEMQADELTEQNTELEIQKRELDEASRLKTNFLSNMSHELRTPLNSVIALSGVLGRRLSNKIPEEESSFLEIIERNGKNLLTMINDILDISRIESGHEEIEISQFNPNDTIGELVAMIQPQAQQQHIELLHGSPKTTITLHSDLTKFRHILQNLISNAVKFTENGTVEIEATQHDDHVTVSVKDSGIGISKDHLPHIFDEFRQADGSTSRRFGGTGLGLAIAKKYSNLLKGDISVKSAPDVGSEFMLTLPMSYNGQYDIKEQSENRDNIVERTGFDYKHIQDISGKTILLVEDNESSIIQIKDLIEDIKGQVHIAHNASEAFEIIGKEIPDAMVLDLMMPDVDGFKVLEMLRNAEITAHIPVLILTAKHITKEELKFLKRNNIHQLIQKGDVKRQELQQAVATMLYPEIKTVKNESTEFKPFKGKPAILLVEDNPDNMITEKALLAEHYIVLEACDAHEGIQMAKKYVPNLILMDIALPDISGIEAFSEMRKIPQTQHIPIIALTASVMKHDRETILSHGFDAFIGKPIIASEFYKVINEVLYGK
jgi:signal transduction histidine kinase/DNA-binding response OmpR family regulator